MTSHCEPAALRDANRHQQCAALADSLWRHAGTILDAHMAVALARRLPQRPAVWTARAEELEARRQLHEDARLPMLEAALRMDQAGGDGCSGLGEMQRLHAEQALHGEWGLTGRALVGRDRAELARQWRERDGRSVLDPPR